MIVHYFPSILCYWQLSIPSASSMEESQGHSHDFSSPCDRPSLAARCENFNDCQSTAAHSDVWKKLGCPRYVLAPMVDASELPWRLLSRRYGAQLCYTPMVAAHQFTVDKKLRAEILQSTPEDRPLIVQFCGNDAKNLTAAARLAEPHCDGIDINIGCPQMVAKRGRYGAYLQDEWTLLTELVAALRAAVRVPISCKIRIYDSIEKTVAYARMLEEAGCQLLAVHGRTVHQRGINTGLASWEHITAVVKALRIPVIANGNIQCRADVDRCLAKTGAAAVMTAEGNMHNPALFTGEVRPAWDLANEYLDLAEKHPVKLLYARGHVFNLCHHLLVLPENHDMRYLVGKTNRFEDLRRVVNTLRERFVHYHEGRENWTAPYETNLKLPPWICQPYVRPTSEERAFKLENKPEEEKMKGYSASRLKKKRKQEAKECGKNRKKPELCTYTKTHAKKKKLQCCNPRGQMCGYNLCRTCCKDYCVNDRLDCRAHRHFKSKEQRLEFLHETRLKRDTPANGSTEIESKRVKLDSSDGEVNNGLTEIDANRIKLNGDRESRGTNGLNTTEMLEHEQGKFDCFENSVKVANGYVRTDLPCDVSENGEQASSHNVTLDCKRVKIDSSVSNEIAPCRKEDGLENKAISSTNNNGEECNIENRRLKLDNDAYEF